MSVEYCVLRVPAEVFEKLPNKPSLIEELMDEFYASQVALKKEYIDARDVIRGLAVAVPANLRMLYVDEFTTSLLVDFMDESSALFQALVGWGKAHLLNGVSYGYGEVSYYSPQEVEELAQALNKYSSMLLEARFQQQAELFRVASAGYFHGDQAILAHQQLFAKFLSQIYKEATLAKDYMLLMTV